MKNITFLFFIFNLSFSQNKCSNFFNEFIQVKKIYETGVYDKDYGESKATLIMVIALIFKSIWLRNLKGRKCVFMNLNFLTRKIH